MTVRMVWGWGLWLLFALILPVKAQTVEYIHTDALGTPVAVTDANRNVIERSEYEPYGALLNRPISDGPGYTGHVQDAATGLTYMQQRYYDPGIGRFLSVDPIAANPNTGASFNRYAYAANNPFRYFDPDGRQERERKDWSSLTAHSSNLAALATSARNIGGNVGNAYTGNTNAAPAGSKAFGPLKSGYVPATANPTQPNHPTITKSRREVAFFSGETSLDFQAAGPGIGVAASKGLTGTGDKASAVVGAGYQATYNFNILKISWSRGDGSSGSGLSLGGAGLKFAYVGGIDAQFNVNQGGEEFVLNGSIGFSTAVRAGSIDYSTEK